MKSWIDCELCGRCISKYKITNKGKVVCKFGCKPKQGILNKLKKAKEKEPAERQLRQTQGKTNL